MNNKKGISAIVATVLIILITVAAITIIWAAIIPMISNQLESGTVCLDAVSGVQLKDEGYTCVNSDGIVTLQISRTAKDFDLNAIQILISVDGDTNTETRDFADEEFVSNGAIVINTSTGYPGATKVQIAPVVGVGNTEEQCDISATKTLTDC